MKTAGSLSDRTKTELANLARSRGVRGWESMDKVALVRALSKVEGTAATPGAKPAKSAAKATRPVAKASTKIVSKPVPRITRPDQTPTKPAAKPAVKVAPKATKPTAAPPPAKPPVAPVAAKPAAPAPTTNGSHKPAPTAAKPVTKPLVPPKPAPTAPAKPIPAKVPPREPMKDIAVRQSTPMTKDRVLLAVSNPYWLNAYWEISPHSVQRAEAALRQDWHGARMIIRLFDVTSLDTTSTSETPVKDIIVHGPGQNWYIDVPQPPRMYRADLGYVSRRGEFYVLARSNVVTPPKASGADTGSDIESGWDDNDAKWKAERILAMSTGFESTGSPELRELFEERLGRPLGPPKETAFGTGAMPPGSVKKFFFEIDAKLIVFGRTDPSAHLTLNNDPIKLNPDGTFRMTFNLPDSRQIIPAVAASADGVEERTIVLAVERNTKHLDPMIHDQMNEV